MINCRVIAIIPAFNEASTITNVVKSLRVFDIAVLVVDDGSSDKTAQLARLAGASVTCHNENKGYEDALSTGITEAINQKFEVAITFDADGQLEPNDITRYIELMNTSNSDLVVGIRNYRNRYTEYLVSLYGRIRFGLNDPLCGMKLYRLELLEKHLPFDQLKLIGMEMTFKLIDSGCIFTQIPIYVKKRKDLSRYGSSFYGEVFILNALIIAIKNFGLFNKKPRFYKH